MVLFLVGVLRALRKRRPLAEAKVGEELPCKENSRPYKEGGRRALRVDLPCKERGSPVIQGKGLTCYARIVVPHMRKP